MKFTLRLLVPLTSFPSLLTATLLAALSLGSAVAQQSGDDADGSAARKMQLDNPDLPLSRQQGVPVMVEFVGAPAATAYADALRSTQQQVDAQRNYALAHPNLKASKALLAKPAVATTVNATAARQVAARVKQLDASQRAALPNLTGNGINGRVVFRSTRAYNGIAMVVPPDKIAQIAALPGVK